MDDTISGTILNYGDEVFEESLDTPGLKGYIKAFWSGIVQGFVDFMFVFGTVCWVFIVAVAFFKKKGS